MYDLIMQLLGLVLMIGAVGVAAFHKERIARASAAALLFVAMLSAYGNTELAQAKVERLQAKLDSSTVTANN